MSAGVGERKDDHRYTAGQTAAGQREQPAGLDATLAGERRRRCNWGALQRQKPGALLVPELPIWIEEIIVQLLEKDPEKRIPDAIVLQRRLEQALKKIELSASEAPPGDDETEITLAEGELIDEDTSTVAVTSRIARTPRPAISGPATLMQRLLRAELEDMLAGPWYQRLFNNSYVLVILLVATLAGGVWWFWPRSIDPAARFAAGVELLKQPAGPEWLRARREFFEPLLQMDPERWGNELKPYLQRIELYEITRPTPVLGRRSRVKGQTTDQKSTAASKGEIAEQAARFLQLARAHQQMGDVGRAERILLALRELLRDDPLQERALSLTSEYLNRLRNERQEESDRDQMVLASLGRADRLAAEGQIEAARKIWQSVLELFGEDPLATAHIDRARESLAKYPALSADKKAP